MRFVAAFLLIASLAGAQPVLKPRPLAAGISPAALAQTALQEAWGAELEEPEAAAEFMAVFHHTVFLGWNAPNGCRLVRVEHGDRGLAGKPAPVPATALGERFRITALGTNPGAAQFLVAGTAADGAAEVHAATIGSNGQIAQWRKLPAFPGTAKETVLHLLSADGFAMAITDRTAADGKKSIGGWAGRTGEAGDAVRWMEMPAPAMRRENFAAAFRGSDVLLLGGTWSDPAENANGLFADAVQALSFERGRFGEWRELAPALSFAARTARAACSGATAILAEAEPGNIVRAEDGTTTQTIFAGGELAGGRSSEWRPVLLSQPQAKVRALAIDAPFSRMIVLSAEAREDGERAFVRGYDLPPAYVTRRLSDKEMIRLSYKSFAAEPPRQPKGQFLEGLARENRLGLVVLTGSEAEDLDVRVGMRETRYRYMVQAMAETYATGPDAAEWMKELGVKSTPAYVVVDRNGAVVSRHEGSIPTPEELFALTSKSREAAEPAPAPTPAEQPDGEER